LNSNAFAVTGSVDAAPPLIALNSKGFAATDWATRDGGLALASPVAADGGAE
jgi:hypothetical protein